ncbi:MAG: thymidine phosphorylase [Anaerolineaceae bacterium]|nr:thymidine phosphorylase [Anaerolineaceae bacterium]
MRAVDIIARKRDGLALTAEQIDFFVQGFTQDTISDYQVSAWLMAVVLQGMDPQETIDLTMAMVRSGEQLNLEDIASFVVDKHSTGGVGDKTTLVVAPLVASAGVYVGKMSGRGLGFTGGTLDKLESIPGFRADLSIEEFRAQLASIGLVVTGQSGRLVPADGKLYALRDVTATVNSLPLIASSIMSKKIAAGTNGIVLDVKLGHGAFMQTEAEALELASLMVRIGTKVGRKVRALLSDMSQPLGRAVGNALELREALDTLHGHGPADFRQHCLALASQMMMVAGGAESATIAEEELGHLLDNRQALAKFRTWIEAQGGDVAYVDDPSRLPAAKISRELPSPRTGYVAALDAREVGLTSMLLGGGRAKKGDSIDHAVGVVLHAKIGDRVEKDQPLLTLHANDEGKLAGAQQRLLAAYEWSDEPVDPPPLIHRVVT